MTRAPLPTADRRTRCRFPRCGTGDSARIPRGDRRAGGRDSAAGRRRQTSRRRSRWRSQTGCSAGSLGRARQPRDLVPEVLQAQRDPLESYPKVYSLELGLRVMISSGYIRVPLGLLSMSRRPTSSLATCVWIPLFALRCEEARHEGLAAYPTALLAPDTTRKLWQVSSLARHAGVKPGMTVSQAIGLCSTLRLIEPDPVHYDERFASLLASLSEVSPVIETGELGLVYVGCDGLEGIYGGPEKVVEAIRRTSHAARVGWGVGKFTAWVAASRAKPSEAIVVPAGEEQKFLASQPISVLPLDSDTHRRLRQLGIRTLGALAALPEAAVTAQFGALG